MYLETDFVAQRLGRITSRAQANAAAGLAEAAARAEEMLNRSVACAVRQVDRSDDMAFEGERRQSARFSVRSQVLARRIGGANFEVALDDVSTSGCRIELIEECDEGEDIVTRFPQLEPLGALVRWKSGKTGGLEFLKSIHPAIFDSLLTRLPQRDA
jgi:hypothetical protein